jgi:hypothetical protein
VLKLLPVLLSASSRIRLAKSDLPVDKLIIFEYSRWMIERQKIIINGSPRGPKNPYQIIQECLIIFVGEGCGKSLS